MCLVVKRKPAWRRAWPYALLGLLFRDAGEFSNASQVAGTMAMTSHDSEHRVSKPYTLVYRVEMSAEPM